MKNIYIHITLVFLYCLVLHSCTKEEEPIAENHSIDKEEPQKESEPCLSSNCALLNFELRKRNVSYEIDIYSSFDILRKDTVRSEIKSAIFVIHGNNRNAKDYFKWMVRSIAELEKEN